MSNLRPARNHGCQLPWRWDQILAWILQPVVIGMFAAAMAGMPDNGFKSTFVGILVPLILIGVTCWAYCQLVDPCATDGTAARVATCWRRFDRAHATARYCSVCRKTVPGLDHHCKWLNTCVGSNTYLPFYLLSLVGTLVFGLQALACLLLLLAAYSSSDEEASTSSPTTSQASDDSDPSFSIVVTTWCALVASAGLCATYASLWVYHTMLLHKGQTTYEHMLEQRNLELAERSKKAAGRRDNEQLDSEGDSATGALDGGLNEHLNPVGVSESEYHGIDIERSASPSRRDSTRKDVEGFDDNDSNCTQ